MAWCLFGDIKALANLLFCPIMMTQVGLMFSLMSTCNSCWTNNRRANDFRRHTAKMWRHCTEMGYNYIYLDDVIKWKHFPRYWPSVRGIHRSPVNSQHKGQWRGALMFSLICTWINVWVNNREAGDLRRHCAHYDVIVMYVPRNMHTVFLLYDQSCIFMWCLYTFYSLKCMGGIDQYTAHSRYLAAIIIEITHKRHP